MNKAFLMGTVESDLTVRVTPAGAKTVSFRMATRESFRGRDGQDQERSDWHNVVCWGQQADAAETLRKGDLCLVEGRIQTRSWDDATTGQKKYMTEINVRELERVGAGQAQDRQPPQGAYGGGRSQPASGGGGRRSGPSPDAGRSNSGRQGNQNDRSEQAFDDDVPF